MPKKTAKRKAARPSRKPAPPPLPVWARRMKAARDALGLSVRAAAGRAGIRAATWSDLETGTAANPQALTLQAVADGLGIPLASLFREPRA